MRKALNPYSPGAGRTPAAFVGRDSEIEAWFVGMQRVEAHLSARPLALYGLRGVGKTVLLNQMRRDAEGRGWLTAKVEAGSGKSLRQALGEALYGPLSDLARPSAGARLLKALRTALSFKASYDSSGTWSFGIDLDDVPGGGADSGVLETDLGKLLKDLSFGAAEEGGGLAVLIDEAQDLAREELTALCAVAHQASQDDWPLLLAVAGLPSLPRDLSEARSYAERLFEYHHVHTLGPSQSRDALASPAQSAGVEWEDAALEFVIEGAVGYPYFLQQYGESSWNEADSSPITLTDARVGVAAGTAALDAGFFRSRWDRATPMERDYLRAMAEDLGADSLSGQVARRMGRSAGSIAPARANLIAKGLIYAPEHGRVAFTVPGMDAFIRRQPTE